MDRSGPLAFWYGSRVWTTCGFQPAPLMWVNSSGQMWQVCIHWPIHGMHDMNWSRYYIYICVCVCVCVIIYRHIHIQLLYILTYMCMLIYVNENIYMDYSCKIISMHIQYIYNHMHTILAKIYASSYAGNILFRSACQGQGGCAIQASRTPRQPWLRSPSRKQNGDGTFLAIETFWRHYMGK